MIVCSLATLGTKSSALPISFSLAIMGVLSGIAFVVWEIWLGCSRHRFPETEPMIPLRLIRNRIYVGASLCCWFTGWIYLSVLVILPERFQIVNREGPLIAGVHLLPMLGTTAFGSFLAGTICKKRNVTALILILAQTLQAVGVALFLTMRSTDAEVKAQNGYQVILGLGIGLSFGSTTMLTQKLVPSAHLAVGQGLMAQMRVFGGAMGIAVCSIVYNWTTDARSEYFNASDIELIKNSPVVQQFLPPHLQELTRQNFVESFNKDIMIIFVVGLVGALFSLLTLDRTLFSQRFARHEESHNNMMRGAIELQSRDSN
ncbi:MFS transporter DHA2 family methylenomycin A resistance protein [Microdochium nivale]|nr:MFS transporter DHA2 family methylenomycin A resistance protein [Microdochium nivale]